MPTDFNDSDAPDATDGRAQVSRGDALFAVVAMITVLMVLALLPPAVLRMDCPSDTILFGDIGRGNPYYMYPVTFGLLFLMLWMLVEPAPQAASSVQEGRPPDRWHRLLGAV